MKTRNNKHFFNKTRKNKKFEKCYIFVYGALMNSCIRKKTLNSKIVIKPSILLKKFGYKRCLCVEDKQKNEIYFGIKKSSQNTDINGILIKINNQHMLNKLIKREIHYYLKKIPNQYIFTENNYITNNDKIYTFVPYLKYITRNKNINKYDNVKDYTEKVMIGYQSISDNFLKRFINTTDNFLRI